jgi:hypothetical protein
LELHPLDYMKEMELARLVKNMIETTASEPWQSIQNIGNKSKQERSITAQGVKPKSE